MELVELELGRYVPDVVASAVSGFLASLIAIDRIIWLVRRLPRPTLRPQRDAFGRK